MVVGKKRFHTPLWLAFLIRTLHANMGLDGEETLPAITPDILQTLRAILLNTSGTTPLAHRFRALFTLKALTSDEAIGIIAEGFKDESALLKHELAYVLGQMGNERAVPVLEGVLGDLRQDAMVRHEVMSFSLSLSRCSQVPAGR